MLQQEFFERTGINLTGEEYANVEHIYDSVQMDKNEFCKLWLENRDNKIIEELMWTIKKLENDCEITKQDFNDQLKENESLQNLHKQEMENEELYHRNAMEEFGRKMIIGFHDESHDLMDDIEEEFGIQFIIKTKLENSIELTGSEKGWLIRNLETGAIKLNQLNSK